MTVAIHQPNYLPWLGYFYKIYACDVFVLHDAVPFSKTAYTKRTKIRKAKASAETTWLTVPVRTHQNGAPISEIVVDQSTSWTQAHWRKISNTYSGAPYFVRYADWLAGLFAGAQEYPELHKINTYLIRQIADMLQLGTEFRSSGELGLHARGSALNLAIVRAVGGSVYLAGMGSAHYEDVQSFSESGIEIERHDLGAWMETHPYDQGIPGFVNGLSVIDALMYLGAEGIVNLFRAYQSSRQ